MDNKLYSADNNPPYNPDYPPPPPYSKDNYAPPPSSFQDYGGMQPGYPVNPNQHLFQQQPPPPPPVAYYPSQPNVNPQAPYYPPMAQPVGYQPVNAVGNYSQPQNDLPINEDVENFGSSFSDKEIRRKFVRKVYSILFVQLVFTFSIVALFVFEENVKEYVQEHFVIYMVSYVTLLVTYFTLICCPSVRRKYPGNVICLAIFTVAMTYVAATISSFYDTNTVLIAAGICAGTSLGITLFSMWTKFDFTGLGPYLCVACWALFFFGIACIFTYRDILITIYSTLGALLMMLFLAYNTQMIMGGKRYQLSPEEYVAGALQLYLDIVYMFLFLLRMVGSSK